MQNMCIIQDRRDEATFLEVFPGQWRILCYFQYILKVI